MPRLRPADPAPTQTARILTASLVGTAIEFYDFYIYATAAALVLGPVFFPPAAPASQTLAAFLTFGVAFAARPIGAILFGHYGDRIGRTATLIATLLVMGLCTTLIGLLPSYASIGLAAPALLCLLRLGQGLGLGGEWGGAALLATENAPPGRGAWFGMFPQLGPPIGFLLANGLFLALFAVLTPAQFRSWGWRIPFLASAILLVFGLVIRRTLNESPAFAAEPSHPRVPLAELLRHHARPLALGALALVVCFALFYVCTVFALSYGTTIRHIPRATFLGLLCIAILAMAATTPAAAALADRYGRRPVLLCASAATAVFAFALPPVLGHSGLAGILLFLVTALALMGVTFAPIGALLPALFPTRIRYTGAATAYSLGGILGGSLAPYAAQRLVAFGGLPAVAVALSVAAVVSFLAIWAMEETA